MIKGYAKRYLVSRPEIRKLKAQIEFLKAGLEDVSNPLQKIEREMPAGCRLDGIALNEILKKPNTYIGIANETLRKFKEMSND
jgi:hypothetical protein